MGGYRHEAWFYGGTDRFLDGAIGFIQDGLARHEPTLVVVAVEKIDRLRQVLGTDASAVAFADMADIGHNPARLIPAWRDFIDEQAGRDQCALRGIGEPIGPDRQGAELVECERHEALLNIAFDDMLATEEDLNLRLLCPYDTEALPAPVIDEARRNHLLVSSEAGPCQESPSYRHVEWQSAPLGGALAEPPEGTWEMKFDARDLVTLRSAVAEHARLAGLDDDQQADLVLSVNEIAANSIQYGGGSGALRIWQDGDRLLCEVRDHGYISDPLIGRKAPGMAPESSRGLWVVNQLCDLVQVRSSGAGTVVRLHMSAV